MFEELIGNLRACSRCDFGQDCGRCTLKSSETTFCCDVLLHEAADAIEELQAQINGWIDQERKSLLKSVPRWIPVTERLPKEEETVLAFGTLGVAWLDWRHDNKWCCYGGVTHWMTLPEPPKNDKDINVLGKEEGE